MPQGLRRKRRYASNGQAPVKAAYPHHVWAIDFQADHLEDGTGFKIASVLNEHTLQVFDDTVDVSITGGVLVDIIERLALTHGLPKVLRMGNGPELTRRTLAQWAAGVVDLAFIPTGEPWKNGYVESFHSREQDEFLDITTFPTLLHARVEISDWHREYNHARHHSSLGYKTPNEYAESCTTPK